MARLFGDDKGNRWLAVQTRAGSQLFRAVLNVAQVLYANLVSAARRDHYVIELFRFLYSSQRPNTGFRLAPFDPATRKFQVLDSKAARNLGRRYIKRPHFVR